MSSCANAGATTIVAIWTPAKIVISGDSLINSSWTGANGQRQHKTSNDCKIRQFGSNYISAAGNYRIEPGGFDVWHTAAHACQLSATIDDCTTRFRAELRSALERIAGRREVHLNVLIAGMQRRTGVGLTSRRMGAAGRASA